MRKFKTLLAVSLVMLGVNFANALEIVDVKADHWAGQEIIRALQNDYITVVDGNRFAPEETMTRSEFVTALLKVIRRQDEPIIQNTSFKDINDNTPNEKDIILSEQIRMAFGYPDKTFKPNVAIDHNETMSMIANITKADYSAADITGFDDFNSIPLWARRAYIKNVANGLYINHPDPDMFTPKNKLTRAEAAVLFDKIVSNVGKVKDKYRDLYNQLTGNNGLGFDFDKSQFIKDDSLSLATFAQNNKVGIYDNKKVIAAGNILIGTNLDKIKSRKDYVGQEYCFVAPNDVYTLQGTFLYPKGTEFYARIEKMGYSAWRSRPEASMPVFRKYVLPSGESYDMAGVPFTKNGKVVYVNDVKTIKKAKKIAKVKSDGKEYLIDVAHQVAPEFDYKIKAGKTMYILLTDDMVIPQDETYLNLRTKDTVLKEHI